MGKLLESWSVFDRPAYTFHFVYGFGFSGKHVGGALVKMESFYHSLLMCCNVVLTWSNVKGFSVNLLEHRFNIPCCTLGFSERDPAVRVFIRDRNP